MSAVAERFPTLAAVLPIDAGGSKRNRVLRALAAFQDEGHEPSLREIAERAQVDDWERAEALVRRLEADGQLRVQWARGRRYHHPGERRLPRNRYELLLP